MKRISCIVYDYHPTATRVFLNTLRELGHEIKILVTADHELQKWALSEAIDIQNSILPIKIQESDIIVFVITNRPEIPEDLAQQNISFYLCYHLVSSKQCTNQYKEYNWFFKDQKEKKLKPLASYGYAEEGYVSFLTKISRHELINLTNSIIEISSCWQVPNKIKNLNDNLIVKTYILGFFRILARYMSFPNAIDFAVLDNCFGYESFIGFPKKFKTLSILLEELHEDSIALQKIECIFQNNNEKRISFFNDYNICKNKNYFPIFDAIKEKEEGAAENFSIVFYASEQKVFCKLHFNSDCYYIDNVQFLLSHIKTMVEQTSKDNYWKNVNYLSVEEKINLTSTWNFGPCIPVSYSITKEFDDVAKLYSENLAIVFGYQEVTYSQLKDQQEKIAAGLIAINNGSLLREKRIGLYTTKCSSTIVSILGILKAGGTYVPLPPSFPEQRLQFIYSDASIDWVICEDKLLQKGSQIFSKVISFSDVLKKVIDIQQETLSNDYNGLAYILYTSGSTGKPKGVEISHKSVVNIAKEQARLLSIKNTDKILQISGLQFDASIWEILGTLLNGATLYIPDEEYASNPLLLTKYIQEQKLTFLTITPSFLEQFAPEDLTTLRILTIMGEKPTRELLNKWYQKNIKIVNAYGPTEATICTSISYYHPKNLSSQIGHPLANYAVYILDLNLNLVPVGVIGELFISGPGLAQGYHNNTFLTQSSFIKNPFSKDFSYKRLYKTGDNARWLNNGEIDYIGRSDNQVKINGQRIEINEIETMLLDTGKFSFVAVLKVEQLHHQFLVGYYKPLHSLKDKKKFSQELRADLKQKLPDYMIPTFFIQIDKIPLTSNGKVDKISLSQISYSEQDNETIGREPQKATEKEISKILKLFLTIDKFQVDKDLFYFGMTSLIAIQFALEVQKKLTPNFRTNLIFKLQNIERISCWIDEDLKNKNTNQNPVILKDRIPSLSSSQKRVWFINQLEGSQSLTYSMPIAYEIIGNLSKLLLQKAFNKIIQRHEMLRSTFPSKNGVPYINTLRKAQINISEYYLKSKGDNHKEEIMKFINQMSKQSFDLSKGPLIYISLGRLSEQHSILIINKHNIITDGWSEGIILKELSYYYNSYVCIKNEYFEDLPAPCSSFNQFSEKEESNIQSSEYQAHLDYWLTYLKNYEEMNFPTDFARKSIVNRPGKRKSVDLTATDLKERINLLCRTYKVTPYIFFLSVFYILLYRYTSQKDLTIGTANAMRDDINFQNTVGFFANTIVSRFHVDPSECYEIYLQKLKQNCFECYEHHSYPFEHIVEHLELRRDLIKSPLFQVMMIMQDTNNDFKLDLKQCTIKRIFAFSEAAMMDFVMNITYTLNTFRIDIDFDSSLFHEETILRLMDHFQVLINSILKDQKYPISSLQMLSTNEIAQIEKISVGKQKNFDISLNILKNFEKSVEKYPKRKAIEFSKETLTYEELNKKANILAHHLKELLPSNSLNPFRIGISIARSNETLISILAIMKAGHAFVPIPPEYPYERIKNIVNDADLSLLLYNHTLDKDKLDQIGFDKTLNFDQLSPDGNSSNLETYLDGEETAYIVYTSGSTGKPKGVEVQHKSLINTIYSIGQKVNINENDRLISVSSIGFDMFICDLFLPLFYGAQCIMCEIPIILDPFTFVKYLKEVTPTFIEATPAFLGTIVDLIDKPNYNLTILTGGETLSENLFSKLKKISSHIYNCYGPAECAVWSTISEDIIDRKEINIGFPLDNVNIYILNNDMQRQPLGIKGQICISGVNLAKGYWNDSKKTEEKFIQNPFKRTSKLYKTGDIGYFDKVGRLYYIAREDRQVKIRGTRIELGEIEYIIQQSPYVYNCIVTTYMLHEHKNLVAYIILKSEFFNPQDCIKAIKDHIEKALSKPMIPTTFIVIDKIPMTTNSKIDYKQLPDPLLGRINLNKDSKSATSKTEKKVEKIWSHILNLENIDIESNFFDIGGNSINIPQVIFGINQEFKCNVTIRDFMQNPTIESISNLIDLT